MRRLAVILAVSTALATTGLVPSVASPPNERADRYIVVLRDDVPSARAAAADRGIVPEFVYEHALKGYAADLTPTQLSGLAADRRVAFVERDGIVRTSAVTWGLDRIDQATKELDGAYNYAATGKGVTAYVLDTGINTGLAQFGARAVSGWDFVDGDSSASDCDGHGTHVAGTIGSATYGVAKDVSLVAVRVLDCNGSGTWSGVIAGVDWVATNATSPSVANMSLGGGASTAVDTAVRSAIARGVTFAVAAGNGNQAGVAQDACRYSPARVPTALTISATDRRDRRASFANYGSCVDWFAPGVGIESTTMSGGVEAWSGTSMATPHVAGVVAQYLQGVPTATPDVVRAALAAKLTAGVVGQAKSPNLLIRSF